MSRWRKHQGQQATQRWEEEKSQIHPLEERTIGNLVFSRPKRPKHFCHQWPKRHLITPPPCLPFPSYQSSSRLASVGKKVPQHFWRKSFSLLTYSSGLVFRSPEVGMGYCVILIFNSSLLFDLPPSLLLLLLVYLNVIKTFFALKDAEIYSSSNDDPEKVTTNEF